ncbi:MAG: YHS domain-containing protein [Candidatus Portiera sp.]|nr:YHS domain-containing protein [Portiera sp.]
MKKIFVKPLIVMLLGSFAFSANAAESVYQTRGIAIKGYDTVAYFTQNEAVKGDKSFSTEYKGATWIFASAANLELFKNEPTKYAPQYNGWCAFAMGDSGKKVKIDPKIYTIKEGKLYLNYNKKTGKRFNEDIDNYIATGDKNWAEIISN